MDNKLEKEEALKATIQKIEKDFGKGSIMKLGDTPIQKIPSIPTGNMALDIALGIGGIPRGRVTEIYGAESSGKTSITLAIIAECQKNGGVAAFIDAEHALDVTYAQKLGVNVEELYISQPDSGEQALEITEYLVRSAAVDLVVVDSVAALTPRAELKGDMGDAHVGIQARLMSQALRKLTSVISKTGTAVIFINQTRSKIGIMFGSPITTSGGNALKFYSSVRIEVNRAELLKKSKNDTYGIKIRAITKKNKVAPPFKKVEIDLVFNEGFLKEASIVDCAVNYNIIEKAGSWYSYNNNQIGQGRDNVVSHLIKNKKTLDEIELKVLTKANLPIPSRLIKKNNK